MAEKRRFLDVWIIESNTVYREVPFTVVADWVQQGRLLADDMLRPSGTAEWFRLGDMPSFAAYLPRSEPYRAGDQAEALEPVEVDFAWKRRPDEDPDDVDMIPLIDVSLVLLIFFMMTASAVAAAAIVATPPADYGKVTSNRELWIGVRSDDNGDPASYFFGTENNTLGEAPDLGTFLNKLDDYLKTQTQGPLEVTVNASENLKSGVVRKLIIELEKRRAKVGQKHYGVSEKRP